jgi:hypothetical protein
LSVGLDRDRQREPQRRVRVLRLARELDLADVLVERARRRAAQIHLQRAQVELVGLIVGDEEVDAERVCDGETTGGELRTLDGQ